MNIAVLSDIHGNLEAFEAVLRDLEDTRPDRVVCLGDAVGYGPDPEAVVRRLQSLRIPCVMGNHEWALMNPDYLEWFNPSARQSLELTRELLSPQGFRTVTAWPTTLHVEGALCVHGCPPQSVTRYLFEVVVEELPHLFSLYENPLCFVGHTHQLLWVRWDGNQGRIHRFRSDALHLQPSARYIVNVGSVGQPRDGDNRAKYVIWNTESSTIVVRRVAYDIAKTVQKILALGFPRINADRLW
ncbi:metallophosphoesterase family protein [Desulfosoma caldarium]|uniref:Putative phosphodiesterase n=1 Tax=Desulfosoma caldarium TaxID=610254 RepID=A0A3N1UI72_9BACT|nr:metallophosphoesterase family protein [Desulfosoma caldarium]ROQ90955.1 putative phosphodiesterase [Desulfosoma caldarium]